jgi:hypothetical protein
MNLDSNAVCGLKYCLHPHMFIMAGTTAVYLPINDELVQLHAYTCRTYALLQSLQHITSLSTSCKLQPHPRSACAPSKVGFLTVGTLFGVANNLLSDPASVCLLTPATPVDSG